MVFFGGKISGGVLAAIIATSACVSPVEPPPESSSTSVVGGTTASTEQLYSTVHVRRHGDTNGFCSGTLIAPRVVLSAGHCFDGSIDSHALQVGAGYLEATNDEVGELISVDRVIVHPDYTPSKLGYSSMDAAGLSDPNDLSLIILQRDATMIESTPILPVQQVATALGYGDMATVSGYGVDDNGQKGILNVGVSSIERHNGIEILTFVDAGQSDTCVGDSGGPLYVWVAGARYLAGAVSRERVDRAESCGAGGIYTLTSGYADWIQTTVGIEPSPPAPTPDASVPDASIPFPIEPDANVPSADEPDASAPDPDPAEPDNDPEDQPGYTAKDAGTTEPRSADDAGVTFDFESDAGLDNQPGDLQARSTMTGSCSMNPSPMSDTPWSAIILGSAFLFRRRFAPRC